MDVATSEIYADYDEVNKLDKKLSAANEINVLSQEVKKQKKLKEMGEAISDNKAEAYKKNKGGDIW